jgi:DNA-binding MarR family transcriptional regulator
MRSVNVTSRCAVQYRSERLAGTGLNGKQCSYILYICREPGITQDQLARRIYINKSNVTRQLALMEEVGFIERRTNETDKREMQVYPTQKAIDVMPEVQAVFAEWNEKVTVDLSEDEKTVLSELMERVMRRAMACADEIKRD